MFWKRESLSTLPKLPENSPSNSANYSMSQCRSLRNEAERILRQAFTKLHADSRALLTRTPTKRTLNLQKQPYGSSMQHGKQPSVDQEPCLTEPATRLHPQESITAFWLTFRGIPHSEACELRSQLLVQGLAAL